MFTGEEAVRIFLSTNTAAICSRDVRIAALLQPNTITLSAGQSVGELRPRAAQHGHSLNRIRHPVIKVTNFMNIISIIFRGTRSSLNLTRDYNKSKLG